MAPEMDTLLEQASKAGIGVVAIEGDGRRFSARTSQDRRSNDRFEKKDTALPTALKWAVRNKLREHLDPGHHRPRSVGRELQGVSAGWKEDDFEDPRGAPRKRSVRCIARCGGGCEGQCSKGLPVHDNHPFT